MANLFLLNPYNPEEFKSQFPRSPLYLRALEFAKQQSGQILKAHQENFCVTFDFDLQPRNYMTARLRQNGVTLSIFYYLEHLLANKPAQVADIGCGENLFKIVIPGLHGVDPFFSEADESAEFTPTWAAEHENHFDAAMAINSLHFRPLEEFETVICDFAKIIKPGGRGFVTFNLTRLIEESQNRFTFDQAIEYCNQVIQNLNFKYIIVDQDYRYPSCRVNGNLRLVFEK